MKTHLVRRLIPFVINSFTIFCKLFYSANAGNRQLSNGLVTAAFHKISPKHPANGLGDDTENEAPNSSSDHETRIAQQVDPIISSKRKSFSTTTNRRMSKGLSYVSSMIKPQKPPRLQPTPPPKSALADPRNLLHSGDKGGPSFLSAIKARQGEDKDENAGKDEDKDHEVIDVRKNLAALLSKQISSGKCTVLTALITGRASH